MKRSERDDSFTQFVVTASPRLQRTAYLMCGDRHRAEDVVQTALAKLYVAWDRVESSGTEFAYARQIVVRACIDEARRPWFRREVASGRDQTEVPAASEFSHVEVPVLDVLKQLPPGQRAAVILRYWNDLSVEETAQVMGCSRSTVKTQSSRGLEQLRQALTTPTPDRSTR